MDTKAVCHRVANRDWTAESLSGLCPRSPRTYLAVFFSIQAISSSLNNFFILIRDIRWLLLLAELAPEEIPQ
jgi:hypothetical protein